MKADNRYRLPEQSRTQKKLYHTRSGRIVLRALVRPRVSRVAGRVLSSRLSRRFVPRFARKCGIDVNEAEKREFCSFNDFFTRKLRDSARPIHPDPTALISPCDSLLAVFPIRHDSYFTIKDSHYTVASLLQNDALSKEFEGGVCAIFRLTVSDYHRYCYFDGGVKGENVFIQGKLHTVNPVSYERYPIYKTNSREYTVMETDHFGTVVQMEVGALMVGRIVNHHGPCRFERGEEKGFFEFGGSTVVLLFQKDRVVFDDELFAFSAKGYERKVQLGEAVGKQWTP